MTDWNRKIIDHLLDTAFEVANDEKIRQDARFQFSVLRKDINRFLKASPITEDCVKKAYELFCSTCRHSVNENCAGQFADRQACSLLTRVTRRVP